MMENKVGHNSPMFDSIILRMQPSDSDPGKVDIGLLAETLFYYRKVRMIGHHGLLRALVQHCGPEELVELVSSQRLHFTYLESNGGIRTVENVLTPAFFSMPKYELQHFAPKLFSETVGKQGKGRRLAQQFSRHVEVESNLERIKSSIHQDLRDASLLKESVRRTLEILAPRYQPSAGMDFRLHQEGDGYRVETNLDFSAINKIYQQRIPPTHSSVSSAHLLVSLMTVHENLLFASRDGAEIAADEVAASLLQAKIESVCTKRQQRQVGIRQFHDFALDGAKNIREVINSGERTFSDFLRLLDKAERFKNWLASQPPDADLLKQYHRAAFENTWADKLPTKILRFVIFSGAGYMVDKMWGSTAGFALGAADAFLLDKLTSGWKPNQFIDGPLSDFLKG